MNTIDPSAKTLNSLLRGELSAIETYNQALHKFADSPVVSSLRTIRDDHQESVSMLRSLVQMRGVEPETDSGVWGTFAMAVEGTAALLGSSSAIIALKQGEEHGIGQYEDAIEDEELPLDVREVLVRNLLPRLQSHVASLNGLVS
ncbi:MAG: DUF2383 domain-containing protein [Verrucomicrobiota bacterium]